MNLDKEFNQLSQQEENIKIESNNLTKKIDTFSIVGWVFIGLGIIAGGIGLAMLGDENSGMKIHEFGDYIGGTVASLWSLAGLFFIYVAFLGQQKQMLLQKLEIRYSRFELQATREELRGQKEELIEQNKTNRLQRFENTFFNLLSIFNQVVNNIDLLEEKTISPQTFNISPTNLFGLDNSDNSTKQFIFIKGKDCFKIFYQELKEFYNSSEQENSNKTPDELIKISYQNFLKHNETDLRHYYKNLIQLLKFIEGSEIENKERYSEIVRAQLSAEEIYLLFYSTYNALGDFNYPKLVLKYNFLDSITPNDLIASEHFNLCNTAFDRIRSKKSTNQSAWSALHSLFEKK